MTSININRRPASQSSGLMKAGHTAPGVCSRNARTARHRTVHQRTHHLNRTKGNTTISADAEKALAKVNLLAQPKPSVNYVQKAFNTLQATCGQLAATLTLGGPWAPPRPGARRGCLVHHPFPTRLCSAPSGPEWV